MRASVWLSNEFVTFNCMSQHDRWLLPRVLGETTNTTHAPQADPRIHQMSAPAHAANACTVKSIDSDALKKDIIKILTDWKEQAQARHCKSKHSFSNAISGMRAYKDPFTSIGDLQKVSGIGPSIAARLTNHANLAAHWAAMPIVTQAQPNDRNPDSIKVLLSRILHAYMLHNPKS
jgi:predicted flap endonuclease-1-like 5' DNA nuclease